MSKLSGLCTVCGTVYDIQVPPDHNEAIDTTTRCIACVAIIDLKLIEENEDGNEIDSGANAQERDANADSQSI